MYSLIQDVRHGLRLLRRAPFFTAMAVLTMALGIGATSTIFTFANGVLLRPLPGIVEAERLVTVGRTSKSQGFDNSSYPNFRDLRDQNTVFSDVAAVFPLALSVSQGGRADRVKGAVVSPNYFRTLGVQFARGRGFLATAGVNGTAAPEVVISYGLWRQRFGGDPNIAGKTVAIDGVPMMVAGVTGHGFIGTDATAAQEAWVPMSVARQVLPSWLDVDESLRQRDWVWVMLYARLKPGVTLQQANADVQTVAARLRAAYPELKEDSVSWAIAPGVGLNPAERADLTRLTAILFGVVGLLLLLACANVSNLLLARATARQREITIRLALGAARGRLIRQLLTESVLVTILGAFAGVGFSFWASTALSGFFDQSARFSLAVDLTPDWRVLIFTFVIAALTGVLVGIVPAVRSGRTEMAVALKDAVALAPRRSHLRPALVAAQLALSLVLLVSAGLLLRTLWNFNRIRLGFNPRGLALMTIEPALSRHYAVTGPGARSGDSAQYQTFYQRLLERLQALPGVESATLARVAPVSARGWGVNAHFPDKPDDPNHGLQFNTVAPNYFDMMGIPIVRGRGFTEQDNASSPPVMVINETLARTVWPHENAIGKLVYTADEKVPRRIIGIVPDMKYRSLLETPKPFAYMSMWQPYPIPDAPTVIHVRTHLPLAQIAAEVQREVQSSDPDLPIFDVRTVSEQIADSYWRQRMTGLLIGIFAALALALGIAGMYGVMAYIVAERTREVGIRMALGARTIDVVRLMVREGAVMIAGGLVAGIGGALAATQLLKSLLYGVRADDPLTFLGASFVLAFTGLLASFLPARRASEVDPMVALRYE